MKQYCINCMRELNAADPVCPHCGFDSRKYQQPGFALPPGALLCAGKYLIGRMLGGDNFSMTYVGLDQSLGLKVAVREYLPMHMVSRAGGSSTLSWHTSMKDRDIGRECFISQARKMAKIHRVPTVVKVRDIFYENDTAYIVMDFVEGEALTDLCKKNGLMDAERCIQTLRPIMVSLAMAHDQGLLHRNISPHNIMLDPAGAVWLLDMGYAKDAVEHVSVRAQDVPMLIRHRFSPPEQYTRSGKIGPWTDVYAMCATIYYCITGRLVPEAVDRMLGTPLVLPSQLSESLAATLGRGLAVHPKDRIQSMDELMSGLTRT